jgi:dihydrolipoamide dehydrogenase
VTRAAEATETYDVIVLGGGPPGENAAQYAGADGLSTALVERELVGGECSYWACMPSKALLRPGEVLDTAAHLPGAQQAVSGRLDIDAVLARRDTFTHSHDDSSQVRWAEGQGIAVIRGHARLDGPRTVTVTAADGSVRRLTARQAVVVATGSDAVVPPVPGLREAAPWTSRDVTNLHAVPARVVVLGGGVVGTEATTWLASLGARVTMLVRGGRLLTGSEPFAGEIVADRLRAAGVDVRLGVNVEKVERPEPVTTAEGQPRGTEVTLSLSDGSTLTADELVVAVGRRPRSDDLGVDTVGLEPGTPLTTDEHLTVRGVAGEWLYAVGDVCGRAQLTHMGKYQARVAGDVIVARAAGRPLDGPRYADRAEPHAVPQVVFSNPQVASVGRTERQARDAGVAVRVVEYDLASVAGASLLRDDYVGRARLVVDTATETLVGATFVGYEVAELLHSATVAVIGKVPLETLWHAVPSYPTVSEVWLRLLEAWRSGS